MKSTIVIYGSSTGTCQSIAETIAGKLGASAVDVSSIDEAAELRRKLQNAQNQNNRRG